MTNLKNVINQYHHPYLLLLWLTYFLIFFMSWDTSFHDIPLYPFITQNCFPMIGIITALLGVFAHRFSLIITGIIFYFAFWINMFIIFGILPGIFGN